MSKSRVSLASSVSASIHQKKVTRDVLPASWNGEITKVKPNWQLRSCCFCAISSTRQPDHQGLRAGERAFGQVASPIIHASWLPFIHPNHIYIYIATCVLTVSHTLSQVTCVQKLHEHVTLPVMKSG